MRAFSPSFFFRLWIPVLAAWLAACQGSPSPEGAVTAGGDSIVGGKVVVGTEEDRAFQSVGSMKITRELTTMLLGTEDVQSSRERCSGVLIARDLVLTAAHCVVDERLLTSLPDGKLSVHGSVEFPMLSQKAQIAKALFHRDFSIEESGGLRSNQGVTSKNDLALVLLDDPIEGPAAPAKLIESAPGKTRAFTVRIYGFGLTKSADLGTHEVRPTLRVVETEGAYQKEQKKFQYDQSSGKGICYGDSGGPHFIQGQKGWVLAAISSSLNGLNEQTDWCRAGSDALSVGDYLDWIENAKRAIHLPERGSGAF